MASLSNSKRAVMEMVGSPAAGTPFIFANWNNTSGDVDVLTHDSGHAFEG